MPAMNKKTKPPTDKSSDPGRDSNGRFKPGNPGGVGNPYARQVAILRRELIQTTRPENIRNIGRKLIALAEDGNIPAAKLLFNYTLGLPSPAESPDRDHLNELEIFRDESLAHARPEDFRARCTLGLTLASMRLKRQITSYQYAKAFAGVLTATAAERKQHAVATAELSDDEKMLAFANYGAGKTFAPYHETEWSDTTWTPWPTPDAAPSGATADGATAEGATAGVAAPSTNGVHGAPPATPSAKPNHESTKDRKHETSAAINRLKDMPPSSNGANGKPPSAKPNHESTKERKHEASAAVNRLKNGTPKNGAPKTNGVIGARSKYALLPKSMRPKGVIVPGF